MTFASGAEWTVFDSDPATSLNILELGPAQAVCLNDGAPVGCPASAVRFGYAGSGWSADLASIPGAQWIWAPNITAADSTNATPLFFSRTFVLGAKPSGHLSVAVDNAAAVLVNGTMVGAAGSSAVPSEAAFSALTTIDLSAALKQGANVITVRAQNSPSGVSGCFDPCPYSSNLAGVVFGGTLSF